MQGNDGAIRWPEFQLQTAYGVNLTTHHPSGVRQGGAGVGLCNAPAFKIGTPRADSGTMMRAERPLYSILLPLSLVALAALVTTPGFKNRFTQDELSLIVTDEAVHTLARPAVFFTQAYWHDPFPPALYRPLATAGLALQWRAGGGQPAVYRWVSAALLAGSAVALFLLAVQCLPYFAAWAVAALFAVHPLHVEATALGVNQGELAVALFLLLATAGYVRDRRTGDLRPGTQVSTVLYFLAAALFKENGLVLPALLLAAELTLITDPRPLRERFRRLRPFYLALGLTGALVLLARTVVLRWDVVGTFTADAMLGTTWAGRALTMLGVVPEWWRLLIWPSHLQADYGPDEIVAAAGFGAPQALGSALLLLWIGAILYTRRRAPTLAFGLSWVAIALVPVGNVIVPTGVALAERTLFLASAGAVLAAGWLGAAVWRRGWKIPAVIVLALLLILGTRGSRARIRIWKDQRTLLEQTVLDAPRSYSAHVGLARFLEDSSTTDAAAERFRQAAIIRPSLVELERATADHYRQTGFCPAAVRHYRRALAVLPGDSAMQASLNACLLGLPRSVP